MSLHLTHNEAMQLSGELLMQGLTPLQPMSIPAKTVTKLVISHCVYDIVRNVCIYWGDYVSCAELEFTSDRYFMTSL